jgi:hypothetical protein
MLQPIFFSQTRARTWRDAWAFARLSIALCLGFGPLVLPGAAQQSSLTPDDKYPENPRKQENAPSRSARLGRLPIEWIIGPYIPVQERLEPITNTQRGQIYVRQTFLTAGSYVARAFSAGLDQARGEPHEWGGGFPGYGRRYAAGYGQFVVQNSVLAGGTLCWGLSLGMIFAVATGSGLAPGTPYRETL